jgi:hypothetical protein
MKHLCLVILPALLVAGGCATVRPSPVAQTFVLESVDSKVWSQTMMEDHCVWQNALICNVLEPKNYPKQVWLVDPFYGPSWSRTYPSGTVFRCSAPLEIIAEQETRAARLAELNAKLSDLRRAVDVAEGDKNVARAEIERDTVLREIERASALQDAIIVEAGEVLNMRVLEESHNQ